MGKNDKENPAGPVHKLNAKDECLRMIRGLAQHLAPLIETMITKLLFLLFSLL